MQELDGCAVASISPADNTVPLAPGAQVKLVDGPAGEELEQTEFNLHPDGCVMKFTDRPGFEPQCLLVDGRGRQFGVVRNKHVADLVCNGVNYLHLAAVTHRAEQEAKERGETESVEGKAPPIIITPTAPRNLN